MPLRILLADGDKAWVDKLSASLREEGTYNVDVAYNGKEAQLNLYNNEYFAVIINPSIQNHSGLQVLTYISKNLADLPRFVLLDNEKLLETDEYSEDALNKKGVTEILVKPILNKELTRLLESYQSLKDVISGLKKRMEFRTKRRLATLTTILPRLRLKSFIHLRRSSLMCLLE